MVCLDKTRPGRTVWQMKADERFANPAGIVQGGFLGAFCDSAMGAAAVTHAQGRKVSVANAEMKVSFLAPVDVGSTLTCTAHLRNKRSVSTMQTMLEIGSLSIPLLITISKLYICMNYLDLEDA